MSTISKIKIGSNEYDIEGSVQIDSSLQSNSQRPVENSAITGGIQQGISLGRINPVSESSFSGVQNNFGEYYHSIYFDPPLTGSFIFEGKLTSLTSVYCDPTRGAFEDIDWDSISAGTNKSFSIEILASNNKPLTKINFHSNYEFSISDLKGYPKLMSGYPKNAMIYYEWGNNKIDKDGDNRLNGTFQPNTNLGANLGTSSYKFNNIYTKYLNGTQPGTAVGKDYTSTLSSTSEDLITSKAVHAAVGDILTPVTVSDLDTINKTTVFTGAGGTWSGTDWMGVQFGSDTTGLYSANAFQLVSVDVSDHRQLMFRMVDGSDGWTNWEKVAFISDIPDVSSFLTGPVGVGNGGTGLQTITKNAILTGNTSATGSGNCGTITTKNGALYATASNGAAKFGTLPIAQGGTGSTSASAARTSLGLGAAATYSVATSITSGGTGLVKSGTIYTALADKQNSLIIKDVTIKFYNYPFSKSSNGLYCTSGISDSSFTKIFSIDCCSFTYLANSYIIIPRIMGDNQYAFMMFYPGKTDATINIGSTSADAEMKVRLVGI